MKKRILSIVLAIAMAATLAPVTGLVSSSVSKAATITKAAVTGVIDVSGAGAHAGGNVNVPVTVTYDDTNIPYVGYTYNGAVGAAQRLTGIEVVMYEGKTLNIAFTNGNNYSTTPVHAVDDVQFDASDVADASDWLVDLSQNKATTTSTLTIKANLGSAELTGSQQFAVSAMIMCDTATPADDFALPISITVLSDPTNVITPTAGDISSGTQAAPIYNYTGAALNPGMVFAGSGDDVATGWALNYDIVTADGEIIASNVNAGTTTNTGLEEGLVAYYNASNFNIATGSALTLKPGDHKLTLRAVVRETGSDPDNYIIIDEQDITVRVASRSHINNVTGAVAVDDYNGNDAYNYILYVQPGVNYFDLSHVTVTETGSPVYTYADPGTSFNTMVTTGGAGFLAGSMILNGAVRESLGYGVIVVQDNMLPTQITATNTTLAANPFLVNLRRTVGGVTTPVDQVRITVQIGEGPVVPVDPDADPTYAGKGVSVTKTAMTYGETVSASYSKEVNGTTYTWYRGIWDTSRADTNKLVPGTIQVIKEADITATDKSARNLTIANDTNAGDDWNFGALTATQSYRVWAEVGANAGSAYITVNNRVLDRGDFVYPAGQESNTVWATTGIRDNGVPTETGVRLISSLYDDNYYFDIRYRDADQALDINARGNYKVAGEEYDFEYGLMTARELATEQAGAYEVYVVGIYYVPGLGRTVTPADFLDNTGRVVGYDNLLTGFDNNKPDLRNNVYEVRDNEIAYDYVTVGNNPMNQMPAVKIGTLNVGKATYPSGAALHVDVADAGVGGYIVGTEFEIEDVNFNYTQVGADELQDVQWYRVSKDGTWTEITGYTGNTYTAKAGDVGYYLGVKAGHYNYNGTIQGMTHQVIAKQVVDASFTETGKNRLAHFSNGGKFTVDLRETLKAYGTPEADADVTLSGNGTWLTDAKFTAADKMLTFNFRTYDTVPTTYAPYTVTATIQFPGHTVNLKGYVMGTNDTVTKVVIEPIANKEYDGAGVTTTAKVYVNEAEIENPNVVITYAGQAASPVNVGTYTATASYNGYTDSTTYKINPRTLVPTEGSFSTQYNVGAPVPTFLTGQFNIVNKDSLRITNYVRKFDFDDDEVFFGDGDVSKVFYTPTMDIGGTYYIHFDVTGTGVENYYAPDPIKITVGTGKTNADPTNPGITPSTPTDDELDKDFVEGGVYRLYSKVTGEHLFTTDFREYKKLAKGEADAGNKWQAEKASFITAKADDKDALAVRRFYNVNGEGHVYTYDAREIAALTADPNWTDDNNGKAAFYVLKATTDTTGTVDVYRIYNPADGQHLMTADKREMNYNVNNGWVYDTADGTAQVYAKMIAI